MFKINRIDPQLNIAFHATNAWHGKTHAWVSENKRIIGARLYPRAFDVQYLDNDDFDDWGDYSLDDDEMHYCQECSGTGFLEELLGDCPECYGMGIDPAHW